MYLLQDRDTELCRLKGGSDINRSMFFSSFFLSKLLDRVSMQYDFSAVRTWTKYNVFKVKRLYFPLNYPVNSHWSLFTVDIQLRLIRFYDPMSGEQRLYAKALQSWLQNEAFDKNVAEFGDINWTVEYVKIMPKQTGTTACGILLLLCANCLSLEKTFDYDMSSVSEARVKIGCDILKGALGKIEGDQIPLDISGSWVEDIMSGPKLPSKGLPQKSQLELGKKKQSEVIDVS